MNKKNLSQKQQEYLVSVIIPFYKGVRFIENAIISVKNQTYKNIELIVVNDSPEDMFYADFLEKLQNKHKFILLHHDFNSGITRSLITGFNNSSGNYICFLAQDDLFLKNKIELQIEFFNKNKNCFILYGNMEFFYEDKDKKELPDIHDTIKKIRNKKVFPSLYHKNLDGLYVQTMMIKRDIIKQDIIPVWRKHKADGWPIHITIFQKHENNIFFLDNILTTYRIHSSNTIHDKKKMFSLILPTIIDFCPKEQQNIAISNYLHLLEIKKSNKNLVNFLLKKVSNLFIAFFPKKLEKNKK